MYLVDATGGSGHSAFDTSNIAIQNSAGIEVELRLNDNQLKNFPAGAEGSITLTVTRGISSRLTAVGVNNVAKILLNDRKELVLTGDDYPQNIIISAQNSESFLLSRFKIIL